jgi:hypothetical protein
MPYEKNRTISLRQQASSKLARPFTGRAWEIAGVSGLKSKGSSVCGVWVRTRACDSLTDWPWFLGLLPLRWLLKQLAELMRLPAQALKVGGAGDLADLLCLPRLIDLDP